MLPAAMSTPLLRLPDIRAFLLHFGARFGSLATRRYHGAQLRIRVLNPPQNSPIRARTATTTTSTTSSFSTVPLSARALAKPVVADVWADPESWVVFSDLHLSRRTCDVCLQVLQTVHAAALARKAGIIFLGDFWHSRGALPVELLNMAIMELQSWQCPAIFIPGNHDQVCDKETTKLVKLKQGAMLREALSLS